MAHFAFVNEKNIVEKVLVVEQDVIDSGLFGDPSGWVQTSYNTRGGVHYGQDGQPDGGIALRKNFAGVGHIYDPVRDAFYEPQPYPSWILDENTCFWEPPIPLPDDENRYMWDESTQSWVVAPEPIESTGQDMSPEDAP